ncbi:NAD(P)-dependent oxidoreductase [Polymorphobacter multimanifer]|uniref:2-keto-3-deoxy-L-fuconate dehydrogenase n=1 Tax=Polymorphobacter multimanifer TaxID=1070431 RepID=A0A841LBW7_9SPHN|nr:SDR family oxidoreductase [Polymorphobacter multimanifer]MBB6226488.1 2-keto-3-deoxy-L-fuconate dehydrogenase [Polymorphobacter multimanifer]GGI76014.1 NAD(P)-dependent oxidoreductase [Polymorphobacter multimanifer]
MTDRLSGKTALVTGAAQGIGLAIVEAFVREGASVIATDLQEDRLASLFEGSAVRFRRMDVTDPQSVGEAAAAFPEAGVLVNCAGWVANGSILDGTPEDLARSFTINVVSMATTIRAFLPAMLDRNDGSIINIASVVSSVMAAPNRFAYGTSKAAVIGLTMSVARDFIGRGVRCNAISPGTVDSPSLEDRLAASGDAAAARAAFVARQPMGRIGTPKEIAEIAVLLASDEARFMSGSNIIVDGGMSL